jgi:uncharacterized protein (TIGR03067 family)
MRSVLSLIAVLLVGFAPAPFPKKIKPVRRTDLEQLQGSWVRVSYSSCGRWVSDGETIVRFIGSHMMMCRGRTSEWVVKINPRTNPKHIDRKGFTDNVKDYQFVGLYRLDGDTLMLAECHGSSETDRPLTFDHGAPGVLIQILKRAKK